MFPGLLTRVFDRMYSRRALPCCQFLRLLLGATLCPFPVPRRMHRKSAPPSATHHTLPLRTFVPFELFNPLKNPSLWLRFVTQRSLGGELPPNTYRQTSLPGSKERSAGLFSTAVVVCMCVRVSGLYWLQRNLTHVCLNPSRKPFGAVHVLLMAHSHDRD